MLILLLLALLVTSAAHAPSITGTWDVVYDGDMRRIRDNEWQVTKRTRATLVLQQRGDSVFGTWKNDVMPQPSELRGTFDGRTLKLTTGVREITGQVDGKPQPMRVRNDWSGSFDGKNLSGVMFIHVGDRAPPPRKWEATRRP